MRKVSWYNLTRNFWCCRTPISWKPRSQVAPYKFPILSPSGTGNIIKYFTVPTLLFLICKTVSSNLAFKIRVIIFPFGPCFEVRQVHSKGSYISCTYLLAIVVHTAYCKYASVQPSLKGSNANSFAFGWHYV